MHSVSSSFFLRKYHRWNSLLAPSKYLCNQIVLEIRSGGQKKEEQIESSFKRYIINWRPRNRQCSNRPFTLTLADSRSTGTPLKVVSFGFSPSHQGSIVSSQTSFDWWGLYSSTLFRRTLYPLQSNSELSEVKYPWLKCYYIFDSTKMCF